MQRFERRYSSEDLEMVWKFDLGRSIRGPISVEINYTGVADLVKKERSVRVKTGRKKKPKNRV